MRDIFFPRKGESADEGVAVCFICNVVDECNGWAVRNNVQHGIWGGRRRGGKSDSKNR